MTLVATTVFLEAPVSQSAILGFHRNALACILGCLRKFRSHEVSDDPRLDKLFGNGAGLHCHVYFLHGNQTNERSHS